MPSPQAPDAHRDRDILVELPEAAQASTLVADLRGRFNASLEEKGGRWHVKITVGKRGSDRILQDLLPTLEQWLQATSLDQVIVQHRDASVVVQRQRLTRRAALSRAHTASE